MTRGNRRMDGVQFPHIPKRAKSMRPVVSEPPASTLRVSKRGAGRVPSRRKEHAAGRLAWMQLVGLEVVFADDERHQPGDGVVERARCAVEPLGVPVKPCRPVTTCDLVDHVDQPVYYTGSARVRRNEEVLEVAVRRLRPCAGVKHEMSEPHGLCVIIDGKHTDKAATGLAQPGERRVRYALR